MAAGYTGEEIGSLSATCSGNPYEGIYTTTYRVSSTEGFTAQPLNQVGECIDNGSNCIYTATDAPQFQDGDFLGFSNVIPLDMTSAEIQAFLDGFCATAEEEYDTKASQCSAELRLSGDNPRNKHPGSILSYDYTTTTTLVSGKFLMHRERKRERECVYI